MEECTGIGDFLDLAGHLKEDRLIKLHIETQDEPYHVQQRLLISCSPYFASALRSCYFTEAQTATFYFQDDNEDAWKVLLYWITHHKLPGNCMEKCLALALDCWIIGDKYDIVLFQDDIMLALMKGRDALTNSRIGHEIVHLVFENTPDDSKLRHFITEEVVKQIEGNHDDEEPEGVVNHDNLGELDGIGFLPLYIEKKREWDGDNPVWTNSFHGDHWKAYLRGPAERYKGWSFFASQCQPS